MQVRARLRDGWGFPAEGAVVPEGRTPDGPSEPLHIEAATPEEIAIAQPTPPSEPLPQPEQAVAPAAPRPDPLAPMTRLGLAVPPRTARAARVSRRDFVLAGTIAGATAAAVGLMRLPVPPAPGAKPTPSPEALRLPLFDSPQSYIASDGFPDHPRALDEVASGAEVEAPHVARGPLLAERKLALFNENTGELVKATYWANGEYVLEEIEALDILLRDHHADEMRAMDLNLLDTLHDLGIRLEVSKPMHILSAYRTRRTNEMLAEHNQNVAVNSYHIQGKAVDIRVPGRSKIQVLRAALKLRAGGVGNYPTYVHVDTGPLRRW